jgi:uncharacterized membrane protein
MNIKLILIFFIVLNVSAQTKFTAKSDKNTIALNENVNIHFEVNDPEFENFKPPKFNDFKIVDGPKMSVSSSFVNGERIYKSLYTYTLQPNKSGELAISFATINGKGKLYKTLPLKINVLNSILKKNKPIQKEKLDNESTNASISKTDSNTKKTTNMNSNSMIFDIIIIIGFKLILIFGFIFLLKFWIKKKETIIPIILYWVLGLFFVFMMSFQIAEWFLMQTYYIENHLTRDADSIGSISAIIGLIIYIFIGVKYFKRKKVKK